MSIRRVNFGERQQGSLANKLCLNLATVAGYCAGSGNGSSLPMRTYIRCQHLQPTGASWRGRLDTDRVIAVAARRRIITANRAGKSIRLRMEPIVRCRLRGDGPIRENLSRAHNRRRCYSL